MTLPLIIISVLLLFGIFRKKVTSFFDDEISKIQDLNSNDEEVDFLCEKYSLIENQELINLINNAKLSDKHLTAINIVLNSRKTNPNSII